MIALIDFFQEQFNELGWEVVAPYFDQTMSEEELIRLVPKFDAWIIGDDPASESVVAAGASGNLRAAVKWGVGTDNVDFEAFEKHGIPVTNTPGMFGQEVADIALGYVIALARHTFEIDRGVRQGQWPKPTGISLAEKTVAVAGFGDIGKNIAKRLATCGMNVTIYDPFASVDEVADTGYKIAEWPDKIDQADFIVFACALTDSNRHMLNSNVFERCKRGVKIVNVARGPLIDEQALIRAQASGIVESCALDVFEEEPPVDSNPLLQHPQNVLGSHNASNTRDAVVKTSLIAIQKLASATIG
jgi:D-3-phosphoglycerate dehydrogenase